ncbi:flavin reductase family protein [Streptomyces avidinii]|uniref:Flavin reductase (DIM6/NTAB) family NADH-FMN oxidoreductase RutF n=1 Tax=Streptomyces avidinii TaxID=1895 RepID=A0ABS4L7F2_STRAV|nr:flavin reductase family protein [Streptomyces avidinii]MBP2037998.1 flavin reductase (DIM6/NTAB) family NADH-FMN oxidoreductase RutF [Streptomyces avidinii]GGZ07108.1 oxidoreductase [Streptomyces avidinii]
MTPTDLDLGAFAEVLNGPVYVVTVEAGCERSGCLVGFASQCSIRPPRFVVWLSRENHTYRVARGATHLAVHVLDRGRQPLAELFGGETGDEVDKFARVDWRPGADGSPVLTGARAWFVGRIETRLDGGDHEGFLLAPTEVCAPARGEPASMRYTDVQEIDPGHPA